MSMMITLGVEVVEVVEVVVVEVVPNPVVAEDMVLRVSRLPSACNGVLKVRRDTLGFLEEEEEELYVYMKS